MRQRSPSARFRKPLLYPLSYGARPAEYRGAVVPLRTVNPEGSGAGARSFLWILRTFTRAKLIVTLDAIPNRVVVRLAQACSSKGAVQCPVIRPHPPSRCSIAYCATPRPQPALGAHLPRARHGAPPVCRGECSLRPGGPDDHSACGERPVLARSRHPSRCAACPLSGGNRT